MRRDTARRLAQRWVDKLGVKANITIGKEWRDAGIECPDRFEPGHKLLALAVLRPKKAERLLRQALNPHPTMRAFLGRSCPSCHTIGIGHLRRDDVEETIIHELLHLIFPKQRHWWIEATAAVLAGNPVDGRYAVRYRHSAKDVPSKRALLALCQKATKV